MSAYYTTARWEPGALDKSGQHGELFGSGEELRLLQYQRVLVLLRELRVGSLWRSWTVYCNDARDHPWGLTSGMVELAAGDTIGSYVGRTDLTRCAWWFERFGQVVWHMTLDPGLSEPIGWQALMARLCSWRERQQAGSSCDGGSRLALRRRRWERRNS